MINSNGYRVAKLAELCRRITVGHVGPMKDEYLDEGVPFLRSQNITPFQLDFSELKFVSPRFHAKLRKSALKPRDVVVVRTGYSGTACVIPESLPESNCADLVVVTPDEQLNPYYLAALFNSAWGIATVGGRLVGVAQQHFNISVAKEMEVRLPPREVQDRVAGILCAIQDLITNNLRRIQILEEIARTIYREWFVYFRFPSNDAVGRVNSSLGPIPEEWTTRRLGELTTKIGSGATPHGGKKSYKLAGIPLIRSLNVYDYRFELADLAFIDEAQAKQLQQVTVAARDVLLNITGASVGRCCMVPSWLVPARVNQHVAIIRADQRLLNPFFLLDAINDDVNKRRLLGIAQGGATREALTRETISNFTIVIPASDQMAQFGTIARPLHTAREGLSRQCETLRATRDLLLPRLMSGQLTLPEAEEAASASV